ncbi:FAD-dependent oxidoreductase [Marichromatium gracile]|uniref:NADPH-dependent 2,4-dienoyl-CoA reductase/sulfur reductase-like enzyme n=1 Tax=Marichromatium gracile TaxID=1048 RepID=A0A4R4A680_MARGR|nr:FAD-dependent oxidoreductase [Marichromatium gracile]MBK1708681.1 pyridine nucleotide-disulfide oxidoreductase [Marichromatium gracile]TCW34293.1 NADPH-dependent 2,4-dienoyl-CoA reductase/sulfur reductase-like enzyme [Marichromatium gracile]
MPSQPLKIVVIGGSAAGPKAAAKARRLDEHAAITLIQKEADLSMASCGFPYYVGGVFDDRNQLICTPAGIVRDPNFFQKAKAIEALVETEATHIDRAAKTVTCTHLPSGESRTLSYDRLVIATGATPLRPPVPGTELEGIHTLQSLGDADALRAIRDAGKVRKAVIVGGGLIGFEVCEALHLAGIQTTVIEKTDSILPFLDRQLAHLVENEVRRQGADIITGNGVAAFLGEDGKLAGVKLDNGTELPCELAVVAVGVRPNVALAEAAGLEIGALGGIRVNERMQTSDPDIYAAGDCVECRSLITGEAVRAPYGDLANLQGRVIGQNLIEPDSARFPGITHTGICKVFDYTIGFTGLNAEQARASGINDIETVTISGLDIPGYMGGKVLISQMVAERASGRILGFQCIGPGDASKRVATVAMAIRGGLGIEELANADLPYAPPYSLALDHVIVSAHVLENKLKGLMQGLSAAELKQRVDSGAECFIIDTRTPQEYEEERLGIGEHLIPVGALRSRLDELPADKSQEIILYCKVSMRGYEAAAALKANGFRNVKVLEGGILAWPYPREK